MLARKLQMKSSKTREWVSENLKINMSNLRMFILKVSLNPVHLSPKTIHHLFPMFQQKCLQHLLIFHQLAIF